MPLSKNHSAKVAYLLHTNNMPEQFYTSMFEKISGRHQAVMDMIKRHPMIADADVSYEEKRSICNRFLHALINDHPTRGMRKIIHIHPFDLSDIAETSLENFSTYDSFVVIGCPHSTDIDVIAYVGDTDYKDGKTLPLKQSEIKRLHTEIHSLGYDTECRKIDLTTIYVDGVSQKIIASSKGGYETANIINHTYQYHRQIMSTSDPLIPHAMVLHPVQNIVFSRDIVFSKIRAFAKYLLDYAKDICINYNDFRAIKKEAYRMSSGDHMIQVVRNVMNYIQLDVSVIVGAEEKKKWHDRFKSLTMKLIQIIAIDRNQPVYYTKERLAASVKGLFADTVNEEMYCAFERCAQWLLFRGTCGKYCPEFFHHLVDCYHDIVTRSISSTIHTITFDKDALMHAHMEINTLNNTLTSNMMDCFVSSPIVCTEEFEMMWTEKHNNTPVNDQFIIRSSDEHAFFEMYADADSKVLATFHQCFIFMDQRSPEWLGALHRFVCGNNSATIGTTFQSKYNLIRGAVIELFVIHLINGSVLQSIGFQHYNVHTLGFIVDENIPGSSGFAPDMVLIGKTARGILEFVLVEIKGLKRLRRNSDYYRGLELATKQIHSGRTILSKYLSSDQLVICRGVVVLGAVEHNQLNLELHVINLT